MTDSTPAPAPAGDGRSARKRRAILVAARATFLERGYGGASMDEIANRAAASKQTVYKHFADKQRLFTEVVTGDVAEAAGLSRELQEALRHTEDLAVDLRRYARQHVAAVLQPHLIRLRRLIIGEADRFPELARTWYRAGPERGFHTLAELFQALAGRGLLRMPDPLLAAQEFNWLILSVPLNRAMFTGGEAQFAPGELDRYADEGVRIFLAAYGTAPESGDRT